jgi:hypothetical protein
MADPLVDLLSASLAEQTPVTVYIRGVRADGVVVHLGDDTVELRHQGERMVVRLDRIDAVSAV